MKKLIKTMSFFVFVLTIFAGCGGEKVSTLEKTVDSDYPNMTWEDILAEADGQTVNWYLWGGSTAANEYIDEHLGVKVLEDYNVTINRVGVNNITEAVNIVIGEKEAEKLSDGTVDLFWINGNNFRLMQDAGVTFPNWSEELPNAKYINWEDPSIKYDMGLEVKGEESPWGAAQLQMIYDSAVVAEEDLPRNFAELMVYAKANPGRVTYVAPPEFMGTRFIKSAIYELTGGFEQYNKEGITKEEFAKMSEPVWQYLEEINQYLWRDGETYAKSESNGYELVNNGEIDFARTLSAAGISGHISRGQLPETGRVYCMDTAIADTNYVALSFNGANKAAAMVVANEIINPEMQAINIQFGNFPVVNFDTLSDTQVKTLEAALDSLPAGTYVTSEEKARTRAPEVASYLNLYIEEIWAERIGSK